MQVKSIAECSKGSILQYFRPSLSYVPFVIKIFVLSIFEWPLKTSFTVFLKCNIPVNEFWFIYCCELMLVNNFSVMSERKISWLNKY